MKEDDLLNSLPEIHWGLSYSRYKAVISGTTKEVYEYEHPVPYGGSIVRRKTGKRVSRKRRIFSISRARMHIRRLIDSNDGAYGFKSVFITFTFAKNITSLKEANKEWSDFIQRLNYHLKFKVRYIAVVEFQKRGAVHYHAIFFNLPFLSKIKTKFAAIWGHGFINIQSVSKIRNVGAYLSKYLQKGVVDARLFNEKCYFSSRGLHKPVVVRLPPINVDLGGIHTEKLQETRKYDSMWAGKTVYRRYKIT
jgi:hypothetical protein